jgi:hypothetical protein
LDHASNTMLSNQSKKQASIHSFHGQFEIIKVSIKAISYTVSKVIQVKINRSNTWHIRNFSHRKVIDT